ncbi:hypothetical protein RyT2_15890 [Pseudolactococcus yaeyamensis]
MKKINILIGFLLCLLMMLISAPIRGDTVVEDDVTVHLHGRLTGEASETLIGLGYHVMEVSPRFYILKSEGMSSQEIAQGYLSSQLKDYKAGLPMTDEQATIQLAYEYTSTFTLQDLSETVGSNYYGYGKSVKLIKDGEASDDDTKLDGIATTQVPKKVQVMPEDGEKRNAVYVFYSTDKPPDTVMVPIVLVLPSKQDSGEEQSDITLYPKFMTNRLFKTLTQITGTHLTTYSYPTHNKDETRVNEPTATTQAVSAGDRLTFELKFTIPEDIESAGKYSDGIKIFDDLPEGLIYEAVDKKGLTFDVFSGIVQPESKSFLADALPLVHRSGHDVAFHFSKATLLEVGAGQAISFEITVSVTPYLSDEKEANVDKKLTNKAYYFSEYQFLEDEATPVETGGYKFRKLDGDTTKNLEQALFEVRDAKGQLLKFHIQNGTYYPDTKGSYSVVTSNKDGFIHLLGLASGDYTLTEVAAPIGYLLPDENGRRTLFTVTSKQVNALSEDTPSTWQNSDQESDLKKGDAHHDIRNYVKGTLPNTGGKGVRGLVGMGLFSFITMLMAYHQLMIKKEKQGQQI